MLTGRMTARRSNAKTAYELMSDIAEYILEEPKRVWMGNWLITDMADIEDAFETKGPACGTVGCIAGNALVLTGSARAVGVARSATSVLGGGNSELRDALYYLFHDTKVNASYGTKKYARIVAKNIQQFQHDHAAALRSVRIG